jgi:hypothetical protein
MIRLRNRTNDILQYTSEATSSTSFSSIYSTIQNKDAKRITHTLNLRHNTVTYVATQTYLSHVRDIKEGSLALRTAPQVLLHDTTVLYMLSLEQHGKLVTRKRDHFSAELLVHIVQSRLDEIFRRRCSRKGSLGSMRTSDARSLGDRIHHHGESDGSPERYRCETKDIVRTTQNTL